MSHRFLGSGLTHGASDADGRLSPHFSYRRCECLQRHQGAINPKQAKPAAVACQFVVFDDRADRTLVECLLYEIVAVEAFAANGKKKVRPVERCASRWNIPAPMRYRRNGRWMPRIQLFVRAAASCRLPRRSCLRNVLTFVAEGLQDFASDFDIVEWDRRLVRNLDLLMPLAGQQHDVSRIRLP